VAALLRSGKRSVQAGRVIASLRLPKSLGAQDTLSLGKSASRAPGSGAVPARADRLEVSVARH
jgi:hypothetical protein